MSKFSTEKFLLKKSRYADDDEPEYSQIKFKIVKPVVLKTHVIKYVDLFDNVITVYTADTTEELYSILKNQYNLSDDYKQDDMSSLKNDFFITIDPYTEEFGSKKLMSFSTLQKLKDEHIESSMSI